uniref:Putative lipocalin-7 5 n=1 Tax=Amblyomma triste TaxID=251400 RepID=A0A023GDY0_AMBTT
MQKWQVVVILILLASHSSFCGPFKICTGGCYKKNEEKSHCSGPTNGEKGCPGVYARRCEKGKDICRCNSETFLRSDLECVPKRDCVPRRKDFEQFITSSSSYHAALISTGVALDWKTKCLTAELKSRNGDRTTLTANYREMIGKTSDYKVVTGENGRLTAVYTNPRELWLTKDVDVELRKQGDILTIQNTGEVAHSTRSTWTTLHILHSNNECLILGKSVPAVSSRTPCILWVSEVNVGRLSHNCQFIFDHFCNEAIKDVQTYDPLCDNNIRRAGQS